MALVAGPSERIVGTSGAEPDPQRSSWSWSVSRTGTWYYQELSSNTCPKERWSETIRVVRTEFGPGP